MTKYVFEKFSQTGAESLIIWNLNLSNIEFLIQNQTLNLANKPLKPELEPEHARVLFSPSLLPCHKLGYYYLFSLWQRGTFHKMGQTHVLLIAFCTNYDLWIDASVLAKLMNCFCIMALYKVSKVINQIFISL